MKFTKSLGIKRAKLFSYVLIMFFYLAAGTLVSAQSQGTQSRRVNGIVTDKKTGEGLIGASILVKGSTIGTITDLDGKFSIELPADKSIISVNYVGYKKVELETPKTGVMRIGLEDNSVEMNEVVVVGYGTVKKSDLTGSIATVSTKDMKNTSILSADQAIQGRATGVLVVNNSGAPGSPVSIKIRGIGSFGNTDPLYVVDGMPIKDASFGKDDNPSGINYLNPNDIESIQVLKDASAAAIYGTRGANGVILITTKRGKSGKMRVDVENYVGVQRLNNNVKVLDGPQYAELYNQVKTDLTFPANPETTNWINEITKDAVVINNQVNISGGSEGSTYFMSLNNYNQDGIIKGSGYDRQSLRINSDNKVNSWLKTGVSLTIMQSLRNRQDAGSNPIYSALRSDPTMPVYDSAGNLSYLTRTKGNVVGQVDRNNYSYDTKRIQGSVYAEIELLKNLKYKLNAGLDRSTAKAIDFMPSYNVGSDEQYNLNTLTEGLDAWDNYLVENTLSYSITKGKHKLDALVGYTTQFERKDSYSLSANLPSNDPEMQYFNNVKGLSDVLRLNGDALEWSLLSQLGRLNYSYGEDSKYLVTASIRRDGSSRFGANKKYGVFPSWSAAWKISSEPFFKKSDFLSTFDLVKLRFGWGKVGNQNIPAYAYLGAVSNRPDLGRNALQTFIGEGNTPVAFYVDKTLPNPEVGWETSVSKNLGMDIALLKNSLTFTVDLYDKLTTDLLMTKPLPAYFSKLDPLFGNAQVNLGSLSNKGFEFALSYKKYEGELNYEISGNFSKNFNKMLALDGGQPPLQTPYSIVKENYALGSFYGMKTEGIFQSQEDIDNHAYQTPKTAPGDLKFKDINKDGKIDAADQTVIGNAFPSFNYGFTFNMSYKGFDLNVFTQGVQGNKIYNQLKQNTLHNLTMTSNVSTDMLNYWGRTLPDGSTVTDTNIPKMAKTDGNSNMRFSDYYLEDGSYFRIKTVTLGYTFNKKMVEKIKLSNLRIYATLQNPLTFTKYSGFDPEIGQSNGWNANPLDFGVDSGVYPQARMLMGGLSLSF